MIQSTTKISRLCSSLKFRSPIRNLSTTKRVRPWSLRDMRSAKLWMVWSAILPLESTKSQRICATWTTEQDRNHFCRTVREISWMVTSRSPLWRKSESALVLVSFWTERRKINGMETILRTFATRLEISFQMSKNQVKSRNLTTHSEKSERMKWKLWSSPPLSKNFINGLLKCKIHLYIGNCTWTISSCMSQTLQTTRSLEFSKLTRTVLSWNWSKLSNSLKSASRTRVKFTSPESRVST